MSSSGQQSQVVMPRDILMSERHFLIRRCSLPNWTELENFRPSYGPLMIQDNDHCIYFRDCKEAAWNHMIGDSDAPTAAAYVIESAVNSIQREARNTYADHEATLANMQDSVFLHIMLRDSCFFLQLVLFWFGFQLGYPPGHPIFGSNPDMMVLGWWLQSMFVVGNQLPLLVLETMMNQSFFRLSISRTPQWKKPTGLMEKVLYQFLLLPVLFNNNQSGQQPVSKPCDLLHGLYLMMLGPGSDPNVANRGHDYHIPINPYVDDVTRFPSAKELVQAGIRFKGVDGMGSRGIYLQPKMFKAILYLPCLIVDENTRLLFHNLEAYEVAQQLRIFEIGSFLRVFRQLVSSLEDAKILESQKVIQGQVGELPGILMCRSTSTMNNGLTRNLNDVRLDIREFSRPRCQYLKTPVTCIFSGAVLLQTIFTILQYFKGSHS